MDFQEKAFIEKENQDSKLKTFISNFIADALVFAAALLTVIIVMYGSAVWFLRLSKGIESCI